MDKQTSNKKYYIKNKDKILRHNREYKKINAMAVRESAKKYNKTTGRIKQAKWRKNNPDKLRNYELKKSYNINSNEYEKILNNQNGVCAICKQKKDEVLAVDHCHKTGKTRGLLCRQCNIGLGFFKDNVKSLGDAIKYLTIYM